MWCLLSDTVAFLSLYVISALALAGPVGTFLSPLTSTRQCNR